MNIFNKYLFLAGLCVILFLPFFVAESQLFPFISGKAFAFRILIEVFFGVWLCACAYDSSLRPRASWLMWAVLIFGSVVTVADVAGVSFYRSFWSNFERMDGLITTLHLIAFFLVASAVLNTRKRWHVFFNTSVVASVFMAFFVFLQLAGKATINQGGARVDGTFGNATYLAVFMLFNFFITAFLLLRACSPTILSLQMAQIKNQRVSAQTNWLLVSWYVLAMIFQLISLYHTATRGAILGLIGGVLVTLAMIAIFEKSRPEQSGRPQLRKIAIGGLVGVMVLVGGFWAARNASFIKNSPVLVRFASLSVQEINNQGRRYVWPMAVNGFLERPILGWGQENFVYVFSKYYDPRMYNQEPWFDRAHNIFLDWLVAGGVLGLLSYLGLFGALFFLVWKNQTLTLTDKSVIVGLTAAYLFNNIFVFDNLISYIYFFSLLAFIHAESVQGKNEPAWLARFFSSTNTLVSRKILPSIVVLALIVLIYTLNIKPIMAGRALITALNVERTSPELGLENFKKVFSYNTFANGEAEEQLFNNVNIFFGKNTKPEVAQSFAALAMEKMDEQIKRFPNDARTLLFAGSLRNRLGDFNGALTYLERARVVAPKKQTIYLETGLAYLSLGNSARAIENFKVAYELAPGYSESRILYLVGAIYTKDRALENQLISLIGENTVLSDERILVAYAGSGRTPEAVSLLNKRISIQPTLPELRFRLAAGYLSIGQRGRAVEILSEAARLFPETKEQADYYIKEIRAGRNP